MLFTRGPVLDPRNTAAHLKRKVTTQINSSQPKQKHTIQNSSLQESQFESIRQKKMDPSSVSKTHVEMNAMPPSYQHDEPQQQVQYHTTTAATAVASPVVIAGPYTYHQPPHQPTYPIVHQHMIAGTNPWSTGLFNCFDDADGFIEGAFCGPCQRSRQYNMLKHGLNHVHMPSLGIPFVIDMCFGFPIAQIGLTFHLRQEIRRRYQLEGNDITDALSAIFCHELATCQNYREMAARGEWTSGFCASAPANAGVPLPAPRAPSQMGSVVQQPTVVVDTNSMLSAQQQQQQQYYYQQQQQFAMQQQQQQYHGGVAPSMAFAVGIPVATTEQQQQQCDANAALPQKTVQ